MRQKLLVQERVSIYANGFGLQNEFASFGLYQDHVWGIGEPEDPLAC